MLVLVRHPVQPRAPRCEEPSRALLRAMLTRRAAADVLAGEDRRVILGMVWILISKFAIEDISEEQATAKEGLLLWCKKKTKGYSG